ALETRYRLPGVWIADLLGNEDYNRRHGDPHVFAMKREGDLVDHVFSQEGGGYSDLGGLLLPAGAALDASGGSVKFGTTTYRLQVQSQRFADDNGALDRYTLQPPAPAAPVVVEVPYSTY
ncbi:MAG: decarboxylase, partial [Stenotrophomonas bentonitica]